MSPLFWPVFDAVVMVAETLTLVYLCNRQLRPRFISPARHLAAYLLLTAAHYGISRLASPAAVWLLCHGLLDAGYLRLVYPGKGQRLRRTAVLGGFYAGMMGLELITLMAKPAFHLPEGVFQIVATAISHLLLFIGARLIPAGESPSHQGPTGWVMYIPVPLASMVTLLIAFPVQDTYDVEISPYVGHLAVIAVLTLNVIVILLFRHIRQGEHYRIRYLLLEKHRDEQKAWLEAMRESYRADRHAAHDLHHHLDTLAILLSEGRSDEAAAYIESLNGRVADRRIVITSNDTVDTILYGQSAAFRESGIGLDVHGLLPPSMPYDPVDLCIILSNALENAREACQGLSTPGERRVTIRFVYDGWLQVIVENPMEAVPTKRIDGRFTSSKKSSGHGIGLESIEAACKRQNGFMVIQTQGGRFRLSVTLQPDMKEE